ncbi:MAG: COX15/CtaA family protein [Blastocatellia bacterium]|nr:COX15/CtaA family protein [Blastocatellia bacterium]
MKKIAQISVFAKYAWFVLTYNILVILWGVFLRASNSGDGCGQHWLTCHGEVIPVAPEFKTTIEFVHRVMSALDGVLMLILLGLAIRRWYLSRTEPDRSVLRTAAVSFLFVLTEGAIGAGLVLTGNTAQTLTAARPFWMAGHLINTFVLLTFLTLTARRASGGGRLNFEIERKPIVALFVGIVAILFVGMTGSIAALSHMLFPAETLSEGLASDFSATSHALLRLRLLHPVSAILTSVFLIFLTGWITKETGALKYTVRWSNILSLLILAQLALGAATLLSLAPIVMQLGHLLLADAIWLAYVIFAANVLSEFPEESLDCDSSSSANLASINSSEASEGT